MCVSVAVKNNDEINIANSIPELLEATGLSEGDLVVASGYAGIDPELCLCQVDVHATLTRHGYFVEPGWEQYGTEYLAEKTETDELTAIRKRHEKRSAFFIVDASVRELHADRGRLLAHIEHLQRRYVRTLESLLAEAEAMCRCSDDYTRRGRTAPDCQAHDFADLVRDALAGESRETEG